MTFENLRQRLSPLASAARHNTEQSTFLISRVLLRHDDLKTKEFFPIEAYRKFYIVDKSRFARYKYTDKPTWMKGETNVA